MLEMESEAVPVSMVMTCDDAVEMTFLDGSRIQLSPCGASFLYDDPPKMAADHLNGTQCSGFKHPLYASSAAKRTRFVTSTCREKARLALEFRNRFASRPYLCQLAVERDQTLELYADITHVQWPKTVSPDLINYHSDRSIELNSLDSLATMVLSPSGKDFSVRFVCKLPPDSDNPVTSDHPESWRATLSERQGGGQATLQGSPLERAHTGEVPAVGCAHHTRGEPCCEFNHKKILSSDASCMSNHRLSLQKRRSHSEKENVHQSLGMRQPSNKPGWDIDTDASRLYSHKLGSHDREAGVCKVTQGVGLGRDLRKECGGGLTSGRWQQYAWVVQSHSVTHCPRTWRHPLHLLQTCAEDQQKRANKSSEEDKHKHHSTEQDREYMTGGVPYEPLPHALPLGCDLSHLHRLLWRTVKPGRAAQGEGDMLTMYGRRVSVLFVAGVIYRLFWDAVPSVEVLPGNGDMLVSCDDRGAFFKLIKVSSEGACQERMISSANPPPDPLGSVYSVADVVRRGARLLQCMYTHGLSSSDGEEVCCWRRAGGEELLAPCMSEELLEKTVIPGLGQLEAFVSGLRRGCFIDGVTIEMGCEDMADRQDEQGHGDDVGNAERGTVFQVVLPGGQRREILASSPGPFARHIQALAEWTTQQRRVETQQSFTDMSQTSAFSTAVVTAELSKIQRFVHISGASRGLEGKWQGVNERCFTSHRPLLLGSNTHVDDAVNGGKEGATETMVENALLQTTRTLSAIDDILEISGRAVKYNGSKNSNNLK